VTKKNEERKIIQTDDARDHLSRDICGPAVRRVHVEDSVVRADLAGSMKEPSKKATGEFCGSLAKS